ncbi:MAG: hypothetical protein LBU43_00800 [Candidatus Accumulibacter sp.]|jgi:hypothetical protein|nr:hypothetical protein [Accumulibacter sp.]
MILRVKKQKAQSCKADWAAPFQSYLSSARKRIVHIGATGGKYRRVWQMSNNPGNRVSGVIRRAIIFVTACDGLLTVCTGHKLKSDTVSFRFQST